MILPGPRLWLFVVVAITQWSANDGQLSNQEICVNQTVTYLLSYLSNECVCNPNSTLESQLKASIDQYTWPCFTSTLDGTYRVQPPAPPPLNASTAPPPNPPRRHHREINLDIVGPAVAVGCCLLFILAAFALWWCCMRDRRSSLLGKVQPPGSSTSTALLLTDIQDSTVLWNTLQQEVMDRAISEHQSVVRRLLPKFYGYEWATEGDAFLLAFHSAQEALLFGLEVQWELTQADWPAQLLQLEGCRPTYLVPISRAPLALPLPGRLSIDVPPVHVSGISRPLADMPRQESSHTLRGALQRYWGRVMSPLHRLIGYFRCHKPTAQESFSSDLQNFLLRSQLQAEGGKAMPLWATARQAWLQADAETEGAELAFRGLRVRMGIHAGDMVEVVANKADHRTNYAGPALDIVRQVSESAQGGMIVMSAGAYRLAKVERIWQQMVLLNAGNHLLRSRADPYELYEVYDVRLRSRLGRLEPLRTAQQLDVGAADATVGHAAVVFMYVVGVATLLAWDYSTTREALRLFQDTVLESMRRWRGYHVEAADNLLLSVFDSPCRAIIWCMECQRQLLHVQWPAELLNHELCEEVTYWEDGKDSELLLARGLKYRVGVDVGQVFGSLHPTTGRVTYRGRVMNRAARIASAACSSQVLCSAEAWGRLRDDPAMDVNGIQAASLGNFRLKGFSEQIELYQCRYQRRGDAVPRALKARVASSSQGTSNTGRRPTLELEMALGTVSRPGTSRLSSSKSHHSRQRSGHWEATADSNTAHSITTTSLRNMPSANGSMVATFGSGRRSNLLSMMPPLLGFSDLEGNEAAMSPDSHNSSLVGTNPESGSSLARRQVFRTFTNPTAQESPAAAPVPDQPPIQPQASGAALWPDGSAQHGQHAGNTWLPNPEPSLVTWQEGGARPAMHWREAPVPPSPGAAGGQEREYGAAAAPAVAATAATPVSPSSAAGLATSWRDASLRGSSGGQPTGLKSILAPLWREGSGALSPGALSPGALAQGQPPYSPQPREGSGMIGALSHGALAQQLPSSPQLREAIITLEDLDEMHSGIFGSFGGSALFASSGNIAVQRSGAQLVRRRSLLDLLGGHSSHSTATNSTGTGASPHTHSSNSGPSQQQTSSRSHHSHLVHTMEPMVLAGALEPMLVPLGPSTSASTRATSAAGAAARQYRDYKGWSVYGSSPRVSEEVGMAPGAAKPWEAEAGLPKPWDGPVTPPRPLSEAGTANARATLLQRTRSDPAAIPPRPA